MNIYRFVLERYDRSKKNRYTCPCCSHKREFTRYIDLMGTFIFPEYVGKCNRANNCAYHYPPAIFFRDNPEALKDLMNTGNSSGNHPVPLVPRLIQPIQASCIEKIIMQISCANKWYNQNNLFLFLRNKIGKETTTNLFREYNVGTSKKWQGAATVFWQVTLNGEIRTAKIMLYNKTNGHRVKEGYSRIAWAHTELGYTEFHLKQCFFGEHLLNLYPNKTVGIVESEKSAIVSAAYMQDFVWIACGGKNGCLNSRYHILRERRICLFPDSKAYDTWYLFYMKLKAENYSISISNLLERKASDEQWNAGIDIADILLQQSLQEATLKNFLQSTPSLQLLIDTFSLDVSDNLE